MNRGERLCVSTGCAMNYVRVCLIFVCEIVFMCVGGSLCVCLACKFELES